MRLLQILLFIPILAFGQIGEYYYSEGHLKAKGLNFKIKKPLHFKQSEGVRPNIVQKWRSNKKNGDFVQFSILVKNDNFIKSLNKNEWKNYLENEGGVKDFTDGFEEAENYSYIVLDSYPGLISDHIYKTQRLSKKYKHYSTAIMVMVESHMFLLQLSSNNKELRNHHKETLNQLAFSVVFPDQYK